MKRSRGQIASISKDTDDTTASFDSDRPCSAKLGEMLQISQ